MDLRFPESQITAFATRYEAELSDRDRESTDALTRKVFPAYECRGYLTKEEFLAVCAWKTPRSKPRCQSNDEALICEVSALVRATKSERLRIQAWTLLAGVKWPTASVFLHFAFPDQYPILDYRALWSLKTDVPGQYSFPFWESYAEFCRALAFKTKVTMRALDQALWKYSQIHQR